MTKEESTKIVNFMTFGVVVLVQGRSKNKLFLWKSSSKLLGKIQELLC